MNIFEGARRISKIIYALALVVGLLLINASNPYISRYYVLQENQQLKQVDDCGSEAWFDARVEGRPSWATVSVCGWGKGPDSVELNAWELEKLDDAIYLARVEKYGEILFGTFASIVGLYILFRCIGWIVRGFLGIPTGHDYRIAPIATEK